MNINVYEQIAIVEAFIHIRKNVNIRIDVMRVQSSTDQLLKLNIAYQHAIAYFKASNCQIVMV